MTVESSLFVARNVKRKKRINYERVRNALNEIKLLIKEESDPEVKAIAADAGYCLNRLLLRE